MRTVVFACFIKQCYAVRFVGEKAHCAAIDDRVVLTGIQLGDRLYGDRSATKFAVVTNLRQKLMQAIFKSFRFLLCLFPFTFFSVPNLHGFFQTILQILFRNYIRERSVGKDIEEGLKIIVLTLRCLDYNG